MADQPKSLITKLCEVMEAIHYIPKAGENPHFKYKYATEGDVSNAIRHELAQRHIMYLSSITDVQQDGNLITITTLHEFVDGDSGESRSFTWSSQGQDSQDKGVSKAATSAVKYSLLKAFLIPTGDDPDADAPTERQKGNNVTHISTTPSANGDGKPQEPPYVRQKASEATVAAQGWFHRKVRDQWGLDNAKLHAVLGVQSLKADMPDKTLGQILDLLDEKMKP